MEGVEERKALHRVDSGVTMQIGKTCVDIAQDAGATLITESNGWHKMRCPRHDDHDPSLRIAPDGSHWKCMVCGRGGDAIELHRWIHGSVFDVARAHVFVDVGSRELVLDGMTREQGEGAQADTAHLFALLLRDGVLNADDADAILLADDPQRALQSVLDRL